MFIDKNLKVRETISFVHTLYKPGNCARDQYESQHTSSKKISSYELNFNIQDYLETHAF